MRQLTLSVEALDQVAARLLALPAELEGAELKVLNARFARDACLEALDTRQSELYHPFPGSDVPPLTGTNEKARAAEVRALTLPERARLRDADGQVELLVLVLHRLQHELAALRAFARLVAGVAAPGGD